MAELWIIGSETEWSFVRRQSTEPFSLVFDGSCLLPLSLCFGDDLVHDFVPSIDCQR